MARTIRTILIVSLVAAALPALAAGTRLESFDLQHRTADELIPVLRPLVDSEGAISGSGNVLIIRSTPRNLEELKSTIRDLDVIRRQLMVSVRQGIDTETVRRRAGVSGRIGNDSASGTVRIQSGTGRGNERITQRLRISEGGWGLIRAGESVPFTEQSVVTGPGGVHVQRSTQYRNIGSGFEVRPRLIGREGVSLDIRPFRQRRSSAGAGIIEQQEVVTTVQGNLGEWIEIGSGIDSRNENSQGIIFSGQQKDRTARSIFLRVEPVGRTGGN